MPTLRRTARLSLQITLDEGEPALVVPLLPIEVPGAVDALVGVAGLQALLRPRLVRRVDRADHPRQPELTDAELAGLIHE